MKNRDKKYRHHPTEPPHFRSSMVALAVDMAADFNNILTTVMGACTLIKKDDPENAELLQCIALINASAEHAALLTNQLAQVTFQKSVSLSDARRVQGTVKSNQIHKELCDE